MASGRPKVGVAVFVTSKTHPNCVLLGVRTNSDGHGTYALPGGHLEFGETFEGCGGREVLEETGLKLTRIRYDGTYNVVWPEENYHYVDIVMVGEVDTEYQQEPENLEPHKCQGWVWYDWNNFPPKDQLFRPLQVILDSGYSPFAAS